MILTCYDWKETKLKSILKKIELSNKKKKIGHE